MDAAPRPPHLRRVLTTCAALGFLAEGLAGCRRAEATRGGMVAIEHVTVIDPRDGSLRPDMTVVIEGRWITRVDPTATRSAPAGARVFDGRGKFAVPGLWDMHTHPFAYDFVNFFAPLALASGVTGIRDMGFYVDTAARYRELVASGSLAGPRIVVGGRVDGGLRVAPWVARVDAAADAGPVVDSLLGAPDGRRRADFIKVYSHLSRDAYFAVARRARRLGVPFAGHVPFSISVTEAADAGQRSIEHEDDLMRACSSLDTLLRRELADTRRARSEDEAAFVRRHAAIMRATPDEGRCAAVIATLARAGTSVTPTLVVYQPYAHPRGGARADTALLAYAPQALRRDWQGRMARVTPADSIAVRSYFSLQRTGALARAGVRLLAGTDAPLPYVYPGLAVHDELALLVAAGLTPAEALRAATSAPADFLGAGDTSGTVAPGKLADLLVLDANPLLDIASTRRLALVIANGRVYDAAARDSMLARVRAFAAQR